MPKNLNFLLDAFHLPQILRHEESSQDGPILRDIVESFEVEDCHI